MTSPPLENRCPSRSKTPRQRPWLSGAFSLVAAVLLVGCAPTTVVTDAGPAEDATPAIPVWPPPPDTPRFIFETVLRSAADIHIQNDYEKIQSAITGSQISAESVLLKPGAIAARDGRVYVADTMGNGIVVFDARRQRLFSFGQRKPGTLSVPSGVAVDQDGLVYVADSNIRQVLVFDNLGLYLRSIGNKDLLLRPTGVAADSVRDRIYVVDRGNNDSDAQRLLAFRGDGSLVWQVGTRGKEPGQFNAPLQAALSPDGTVQVLDSGNFRVQSFSPDGKFLNAFGTVGKTPGTFWRPRGLATDSEGRIYVSDAGFSNLQIFDPKGILLLVIGQVSTEDRPGRYSLLSGVAVDETGRIYLVDQIFRKVEVIRPFVMARDVAKS